MRRARVWTRAKCGSCKVLHGHYLTEKVAARRMRSGRDGVTKRGGSCAHGRTCTKTRYSCGTSHKLHDRDAAFSMDVGFLVFGLAGLLTLVCFMPPLAGRLKLPYSVLLAIVGCLLGIIVHVHGWAPSWIGDFLDSLERFEISSETFLMVFLPVLLFETALSMNVRRLMDDIGPILMMAIVAVVVCTVVVLSLIHI